MPNVPNPRRPSGPRDPGDAWAEGPQGRFWGRFGAAGLLVHDPARGVLLQHRVSWSDHGGTWGVPGGARRLGESALEGALREAHEEAGVPSGSVRPLCTHLLDHGYWSYTTFVTEAVEPFDAVIGDPESLELRWVPPEAVERMPLHPGFADTWPLLRDELGYRPVVIVDMANVVGSRPDGWWRDRRGAAERLLVRLAALAADGMPAAELGLPLERRWPRILAVVEGQARGAQAPADASPLLGVRRAPRDGDGEIVETVAALGGATGGTLVVTADRELRERVGALGAEPRGPGWLWGLLESGGRD